MPNSCCIQDDFDFDILDATKVWPEENAPIRYIGELELNRNVDEFFTQTEQVNVFHEIYSDTVAKQYSGRLLHFAYCTWH